MKKFWKIFVRINFSSFGSQEYLSQKFFFGVSDINLKQNSFFEMKRITHLKEKLENSSFKNDSRKIKNPRPFLQDN